MNHPELRTFGGDRIQFFPEENVCLIAGTVEQCQIEVFNAVTDGGSQREEGGNARTAGEADNMFFIPELFIVEETLRPGGNDGITDLQFREKPIGDKAAGLERIVMTYFPSSASFGELQRE